MWGRVCPHSLCHWVNEVHGHVASNQDLSCTTAGVCLHTCMCCQCSVILGRMFPRCTIVWFIFKKKKKTGTIITNGRCSPSPFCWHHLNPPTNSGDAHCHHPLCFDSTTSPPQSPHECQWWCLPPPSSQLQLASTTTSSLPWLPHKQQWCPLPALLVLPQLAPSPQPALVSPQPYYLFHTVLPRPQTPYLPNFPISNQALSY